VSQRAAYERYLARRLEAQLPLSSQLDEVARAR
jgi:hypothetical protein